MLQNQKGYSIVSLGSDQGGEFENNEFTEFCDKNKINHNFLAPRTPQQNDVIKRKNRCLEEIVRAILSESTLPKTFWVDSVNMASYVMNRALIRPILNKTPYKLYFGRNQIFNTYMSLD